MIKALRDLVGIGLLMSLAAGVVQAEIHNTTGDLNIGPVMDVTKWTVMCPNADTLFKTYEFVAMSQLSKVEPYINSAVKAGKCIEVPASSVFVVGVKMAKIGASKTAQPSVYILARVKFKGQFFYVMPNFLMESGFDIIKQGQLANKEMGYELVQ